MSIYKRKHTSNGCQPLTDAEVAIVHKGLREGKSATDIFLKDGINIKATARVIKHIKNIWGIIDGIMMNDDPSSLDDLKAKVLKVAEGRVAKKDWVDTLVDDKVAFSDGNPDKVKTFEEFKKIYKSEI